MKLATKHEKILEFIESLAVGNKISVRQIAKEMHVSEGTAYRAIKEAEIQGIVSTIERVGTIRIEKKEKENIEKLTFAEVVNVVDGHVLGGKEGLHKTLNKFLIGAMELDAMMRYVDKASLLIVGNRAKAHSLALKSGAAVLITGGFDTDEDVKELADELKLPVISTSYDTFTVAAMINRAIYDQLIKKEIVHVKDIYIPSERTYRLRLDSKIADWQQLNKETNHSRFPVVDKHNKVVGVVTAKDIVGEPKERLLDKVMTKQPLVVNEQTSLANAAHMMIWEGIELLPVVDAHKKLLGIISRQDVLKALQMIQTQPQIGETFDDQITSHFTEIGAENEVIFQCEITPQMTNYLGTLSYGVITTIVLEAGSRILKKYKRGNLVVENITLYFLKPVQIEHTMTIKPKILEISRRHGKIDVELYHEGTVVGKALMMAQLMEGF